MQLIAFSPVVTVLLFCLLWFAFQMGAALLCFYLPNRWFRWDGWLYKDRRFEDGGRFYARRLGVKKWKKFLPDGGALFGRGYAKRHLRDFGGENLELYLVESCRAELTHWLAILPFWVFGFFAHPVVVPIMLVYALAVNLPCIVAQRYNRPRVARTLGRKNNMKAKRCMDEGETV